MDYYHALLHCVEAHAGQTDKSGWTYALHPIRVAEKAKRFGEDYAVVALLHDILEDTEHKLPVVDDMTHVGPETANKLTWEQHIAMVAITKRGDETYFEYIQRIIDESPMAVLVKILDNDDNTSPERKVDPFWDAKMGERYAKARKMLLAEINSWHEGPIVGWEALGFK